MAGIGRVSLRAGVAGIFVGLLLLGTPSPASAASNQGVVLTRHSLSSVTADLDGDGAREVVAIITEPESGAALRVVAWGVRGSDWLSLGEERVEVWNASEARAMPATLDENSAGLLTVQDGDRTRVLVASAIPYRSDTSPGACCLSISEVTLVAGTLRVELAPDDLGSVDSITTMDLEADGRDELLLTSYAGDAPDPGGEPVYQVLRQSGGGFAAVPVPGPEGEQLYLHVMGDSDGIAGDELLFMTTDNRALVRVSADGDDLSMERADAGAVFNPSTGNLAAAADGIMVFTSEREIETARWPRGGTVEPLASLPVDTWPNVYLIGDGASARIVEVTGWDIAAGQNLGLRVMDLDLTVKLDADASPEMMDLWEFTQNREYDPEQPGADLYPQTGPIRGGLADGRPAFLGLGSLVTVGRDGVETISPAPALMGGELLGLVGPGSEWVAIGSGWFGGGGWAYLGQYGLDPNGLPESRVTVGPSDAILAAPSDADTEFALDGATLVDGADGPMLYAAEGGFHAVVSGERGTLVITQVDRASHTTEIGDGPVTVSLDPPGMSGADRKHEAIMLVVSPSGVTHLTSWDLTILPEAPEVSADTSFELFDAHAAVFGEVAPIMTVTVDGRAVAMSGGGAYRAVVDASLWPREVEVVVRDPVGQQTVSRIEVVGIVDVRALPWIPIMVVVTAAAGVVLFVRTPAVRPQERVVLEGDGHLEEIDGDLA